MPLIRRVWAPKGKRPVAPVQQRYGWLYICGFVRPSTGETEWWLLANPRLENLETLREVQAQRCVVLNGQPTLVREHTLFHWCPMTGEVP